MTEETWSRPSGRKADELRPIKITRHYTKYAEGSVLIEVGGTKVICTASVEEKVPGWLKDQGKGWVTAEYGMLPRATGTRTDREAAKGKQSGRTQEIQRLIGRSIRAAVDLNAFGERTLTLACDVIQADGGTRTASISGVMIAAYDAFSLMVEEGLIEKVPLNHFVAAISVGVIQGIPMLDLDYQEDSSCDTDMNVVMTESGDFVEIQGPAEGGPFSHSMLNEMLGMAQKGIDELIHMQKRVLGLEND